MNCEHHYCRCWRAAELVRLCYRTRDGRYLAQAIAVRDQPVPCVIGRDLEERGIRAIIQGPPAAPAGAGDHG
jgi:hypothetical protein